MSSPETAPAPEPIAPAPRDEDAGRLDLDQALELLARKPAHLLELETRHGFTFGDTGETGPGRPTIAVACSTAGCSRQGRLLQLHDDTALPVHCGDCNAVVHCEHTPELRRERSGTLGAVIEHLVTACTTCGGELDRQSRDVGPLPLTEIPVALLEREL